MAAPNIVNVATLTGKTAVGNVTTTASTLLTNTAASNQVLRINSLVVANVDGVNSADLTASLQRSSIDYNLAYLITVPAKSTLVVISKDTQIYLEEGDTLRVTASANSRLQAVCSYEVIS